ncbi:hypothetical protein TI39_contig386g00013 [Zymoseptoria brevis]|uniref:Uncharacterized protein n=1 Tax=Zymoseptoria brevis TaxID=1047168 RepID=A0A0F4GP44_9PEZI|nr:hypothetical protein TI39_contig386g00013 [Zymoseptoria brevis]
MAEEAQKPPVELEDVQPPDTTASNVRYSDSPQRWTRITETSLPSPARSIHPEHSVNRMDSIDSQVDFGLRNTDFFEDESSDDEPLPAKKASLPGSAAMETEERPISPVKKRSKTPGPMIKPFVSQCEPKGRTGEDWPLQPGEGEYQRLDSNLATLAPIRTSTPSTTYTGSIDEFANDLPAADADTNMPRRPKSTRKSSARTPRSSGNWKNNDHPSDQQRRSPRDGRRSQTYADPRISTYSEKVEQRLDIHAIAHEVYLNGLFRDEELLHQHKMHAISPVQPARIRESMLPSSLRPGPRRGSPPTVPPRPTSDSALGNRGPGKKVHLVPPPIDLTGTHHSLPENLVRTPYPFSATRHQKDFSTTSTPLLAPSNSESLLTVSVRRARKSTATPRITTITIPASSSYSVLPHTDSSPPQSYDDASFFLALRRAYKSLVPLPFRVLSARSLRGIQISTLTKFDHERGWLPGSRSPRRVAGKGLTDSFSPESILAGFKKPKRGKGRMAFVGWAQRLAAVDQPPAAGEDERDAGVELARRRDDGEGLEFVAGWSWRRILMAVGVVVGSSIAAVLLWVFLGIGRGGPGGRVGTGSALAVVVFLVGMGCVGAWLGISWLVM